jgi:glycosyltransferase involved in cell wall biosynthesis
MSEPWGVSIIVVSYNNERFLAAAIDSALGQNHPLCEVIVVDDCSTDNSRAIIALYGDRIRSVLRESNGHQVAALNSAWPLARHPILIFLDSDDLLFPHAAATVAGLWTAATVKMQFPLVTIDKAGRQLRHVAPKYPPSLDTATLRTELLRTGGSPNSPSSGNAYSRSLLEAVTRDGGFDLENMREHWMDAILECNAPFYGEVVTLYEPLACYRLHDSNVSLMHTVECARFAFAFRHASFKLDYFARRCQFWGLPFDPDAARNRSIWLLECRLAADKLASVKDPMGEPIWRTLSRALKACVDAHLPVSNRIVRGAWFVIVAISPRTVAGRLIALRFTITERPAWLERLLGIIVNISSWRGWLLTPTTKP